MTVTVMKTFFEKLFGIIVGDYNTAKVLNTFFSDSNLNIAEYSNCEPVANNVSDPVLKCVVTYRNHPIILAIVEVCRKIQDCHFPFQR